ncbi:MAG: type II toxin-antitoxin system HigB family toxin [Rhodospirillaceae bacterium]|nr:MAG: type II toxin-antitoxin system HigB family toxin [Rhodospirillaceae bacterium]
MIVVRLDIVERYLARTAGGEGLAAVRKAYQAWRAIASASQWRTPIDVKRSHPKASVLKQGRVVFNIKANDYRLMTQINYPAETVEIRFFGTHAEYDDIDAQIV